MRKAFFVALLGLSLTGIAAAQPPRLTAVDRSTRADWYESRAWGGGATFSFLDVTEAPGFSLGGGGPEFVLGCSGRGRGSVWRFRVDFTAAGSGITGEDERQRGRAEAHYFGAPGTVILFNEMDREMGRYPLRVTRDRNGLETGPLRPADVQRFLNASAIRAETPRLRFEAGTSMLQGVIGGLSQPPCGAVSVR